jgi:hypothetical protein
LGIECQPGIERHILGIECQPEIERHTPGIERQQSGDQAPISGDRAPSKIPDLKDLLTANDGSMIFFCPILRLDKLLWAPKFILKAVLHHLRSRFFSFDLSCKYLSISLSIYEKLTIEVGSSFFLVFSYCFSLVSFIFFLRQWVELDL